MLWRCKKSVWMTICCFRFLAHVFLCSSIILHLYTRPAVLFFSLVHFQLLYFIILWLMYVFYYTLIDVLSFVILKIFCSISSGTNSNTLWVKNMFVWVVISAFCELFCLFCHRIILLLFKFGCDTVMSLVHNSCDKWCHSYNNKIWGRFMCYVTWTLFCVTMFTYHFFHFGILIIIST